jgi:hypothetical protein
MSFHLGTVLIGLACMIALAICALPLPASEEEGDATSPSEPFA